MKGNYFFAKSRILCYEPFFLFQGEVKFKLYFKSGGAIDFGTAMLKAAQMGKIMLNLILHGSVYHIACYQNSFITTLVLKPEIYFYYIKIAFSIIKMIFQHLEIMPKTHLLHILHQVDHGTPPLLQHIPRIQMDIWVGYRQQTFLQSNHHVSNVYS